MKVLYYAYGSNMCTGRLRTRVASATPRAVTKLSKYRFAYHKPSQDGSGKADAFYTGDPTNCVWGVVFELNADEKPALDSAEGLGHGYNEKIVTVSDANGNDYDAWMYYAVVTDSSLKPYSWYTRFVIEGAKQHVLPYEYIEILSKFGDLNDPDIRRDLRNRAICC